MLVPRARPALLALLLTGGCCAPAPAEPPPSPFAGDARLDKPVTVHWKKATLSEALKELSQQTGARLIPERGLVDEPVMASVTRARARLLLEQMARLLHFTWTREGGKPGAPNYLLYQDQAARREEDEEIHKAERAVRQALQEELDKCRRFSRISPEQAQQALDKSDAELGEALKGGFLSLANDPAAGRRFQDAQALRSVTSPIGRTMLEVVDRLSPTQWSTLEDEQQLTFSTRPGDGELRLPSGFSDRLREAQPSIMFPKALFSALGPQVEQGISQVEGMMQTQWARADGFKVTVQLSLNLGAQPVGMMRVTPEPLGAGDIAPIFGIAGLNLIGAPGAFDTPDADPDRDKRLSEDPVLGKKVKLKLPASQALPGPLAMLGKVYRAADLLPLMEEAYGVPLLADAYNRQAVAAVAPPGDAPVALYKLLDLVCGQTRRWERDGDVIRLRSRSWAHDRRSEIPARYMRKWLEVRARKGGFSLDDLAEIAGMLRDEQVESLMFSAMEENTQDFTDFVMLPMNREVLRFYNRLLPLQRKQLAAGRPIAARDLYPFQQAQLVAMHRSRNDSMFALALGARPRRSAERLAGSVLTLEIQRIPQEAAATAAKSAPPEGAGAAFNIPGGFCTIRFAYPDGQKDDYRIPLSRVSGVPTPAGPAGTALAPPAPVPAAPAAPLPAPKEPGPAK